MHLGLAGQVAIVTGGSRGIGRAVVEELLAEGVRVATGSRHPDDLAGIDSPPGHLLALPLDVTSVDSIEAFVAAVAETWGPVHMLVNNAGKAYPGSFATLSDQDWQNDINVKLMAQVRMCRRVLGEMPDGGRIVNLTAIFGKQPNPRFFASSVNRAACSSFTKTLAKELAPRNIRVNAVSIGFVHSGQWEGQPDTFFAGLIEEFRVPLGRFGEAAEASHPIVFLLSEAASYLTGVVLDADGGMAAYL